jgi:hypothetical protein
MSGVRTGLRPKGPDDLPILGRSKAVPGLIYATAHYRNGVMFAPLDGAAGWRSRLDRAADPPYTSSIQPESGGCNIRFMALLKPKRSPRP